jgi:hypothetical protein
VWVPESGAGRQFMPLFAAMERIYPHKENYRIIIKSIIIKKFTNTENY